MKQLLGAALIAVMAAASFADAKTAARRPVRRATPAARRASGRPAKPAKPSKPSARRGAAPARRPHVIAKPIIPQRRATTAPAPTGPLKPTPANVNGAVSTQLKRMRGLKGSFCFAVEDGAVTGVNENTPMRAASVTKTLTTFWALQRYKPDFQYSTRISYQPSNKELHISGARDPYFDRERLFVLMADLNKKGIKEINRVTFDDNFWFFSDLNNWRYLNPKKKRGQRVSDREAFFAGESHTRETEAGDMEKVKSRLTDWLNTATWTAAQKTNYARARQTNPAGSIPSSVTMKVDVIDLVPSNPLAGKPGVIDMIVKSAPLKNYLKFMNIHSVNPYAEELFFSLGGVNQFRTVMSKLGYGDQLKEIHAGSGVNLYSNPTNREDSIVSCSTVVRIIRRMDEQLEAGGGDLSDVMAAPGVDGGTMGDPTQSLVVKTGTLKRPHLDKNLAGVENTTGGEVYFGIFLDGSNGGSGGIRRAMTAMNANHFRTKRVSSKPYSYAPIGAWTHVAAPGKPAAAPAAPTPPAPPAPAVIAKPIPAKPAPTPAKPEPHITADMSVLS